MFIPIRINFRRGRKKADEAPKSAPPPKQPESPKAIPKTGKTDRDYMAWILAHLPKDLPPYARSAAGCLGGWVRGLEFWVPGDRGPDYVYYAANTETEMQYWMFKESCTRAAQALELRSRAGDELRYHYVMDHVENGRWIYRQNRSYEYNTIHDSRKAWMEQALRMAVPVLPPQEAQAFVENYERLLNNNFRTPHWGYDKKTGVFQEISNSPYVDWNGLEQPASGTVIGFDHP